MQHAVAAARQELHPPVEALHVVAGRPAVRQDHEGRQPRAGRRMVPDGQRQQGRDAQPVARGKGHPSLGRQLRGLEARIVVRDRAQVGALGAAHEQPVVLRLFAAFHADQDAAAIRAAVDDAVDGVRQGLVDGARVGGPGGVDVDRSALAASEADHVVVAHDRADVVCVVLAGRAHRAGAGQVELLDHGAVALQVGAHPDAIRAAIDIGQRLELLALVERQRQHRLPRRLRIRAVAQLHRLVAFERPAEVDLARRRGDPVADRAVLGRHGADLARAHVHAHDLGMLVAIVDRRARDRLPVGAVDPRQLQQQMAGIVGQLADDLVLELRLELRIVGVHQVQQMTAVAIHADQARIDRLAQRFAYGHRLHREHEPVVRLPQDPVDLAVSRRQANRLLEAVQVLHDERAVAVQRADVGQVVPVGGQPGAAGLGQGGIGRDRGKGGRRGPGWRGSRGLGDGRRAFQQQQRQDAKA